LYAESTARASVRPADPANHKFFIQRFVLLEDSQMQATFDSRSYDTFNHSWHTANRENQSRSSFHSPDSFNPFNSAFSPAPMRSMNPFAASRAFMQPAVYPQMSRSMGPSFNPYSPQQASYGSSQRGASMTRYEQEVSRTPNGTTMKTSYTTIEQSGGNARCNNVPDRCSNDFRKDSCRNGTDQNRVAPVVSQNGNKLNVDMGNTHSELAKDNATTKMKVGGNDIELTGWGDPHAILKVNGKESKADFSKAVGVDNKDMRVTFDPEKKQSSGGVPPHMNRVIFEPKGTRQLFVGEHLSPSDSAKVSFREVTDQREKAELRQTANNAQKAAPAGDKIIDQKTGQQIV
jgi:hypothetical protein